MVDGGKPGKEQVEQVCAVKGSVTESAGKLNSEMFFPDRSIGPGWKHTLKNNNP